MSKKSKSLGRNVKRLRLAQGLTQDELGKRVGTDKGHISRIESEGLDPRHSTVRALAVALGASLDDLSGLRSPAHAS
jgi:XRE family transcriptional regulator, fatty acid utilization regulator